MLLSEICHHHHHHRHHLSHLPPARLADGAVFPGSLYAAFAFLHGLLGAAVRGDDADGGAAALALELLTRCDERSWCAMVRAGGTTTWETWYGDKTHSHPWGTSPASAIAHGVLGVHATAPAFATCDGDRTTDRRQAVVTRCC